jgi:hypothetical protein
MEKFMISFTPQEGGLGFPIHTVPVAVEEYGISLDPEKDAGPEQRPIASIRLEARGRWQKILPVDPLHAHRPVEANPSDSHDAPVAVVEKTTYQSGFNVKTSWHD